MSNHPNRSKHQPRLQPTAEEVRQARARAGMTQLEAARAVGASVKAWRKWEAPPESPDHRRMHPAFWELFRIKARLD
jgi:DNA-binding transcriptional regulator YiaG